MAKTISSALAQHLAGEVTTLATCWQITRRDGEVLGFTDHVCDLEVDGVSYKAASGYTRTAIRGTADLAVDNLDVESVFSDDGITEEGLWAGRYDFAEVRMFLVNYEDLGQGILKLRRGWLGEVTIRDGMYVAELRGMTQRLQMTVGEVYAPDCSADLGDARCGVDLAALEESGTVSAVTSATVFETTLAQATGWYDGGELAWTGGANAGQTVAVRAGMRQPARSRCSCRRSTRCRRAIPSPSGRAATRASQPAGRSSTTRSTSAASRTSRATIRC
jgi:uncharacterized phage protein (TIGR02218 family)